MTIVLILLTLCGVRALLAAIREQRRQEQIDRVRREQARQRTEQARLRDEWRRQEAEAARLAREQITLAKEQERQAAQILKHGKRLADLEHRMEQAEADIEHWKAQLGALYALLDLAQAEQVAAAPGSKADARAQKQIITLGNQIHAAEARLNKAEHIKKTAEQELSAA